MRNILAFCTMFSLLSCSHSLEIKDPKYGIGIIEAYKPMGKMPAIAYHFSLNGKEYGNDYSTKYFGDAWSIPDSANFKEGDKFLIEYEAENPKVSRMMFDFPIKNNSDLGKYLEVLKKNRKPQ